MEQQRVFCGGEHTLVLAPGGQSLYQLGACGLGFDWSSAEDGEKPGYETKVPVVGPFRSVVAGYYHNLLATAAGRCLSYGCGRQDPNDGQLATGSTEERTTPTAVPCFLAGFCGGHHSVFRDAAGAVRACGAGWQAQMGNGTMTYKNPDMQTAQVSSDLVPQTISGGYYHNAVLGGGRCEVWGCNEQRQLGGLAKSCAAGDNVKTPENLRSRVHLPEGTIEAFDGGYGHSVVLVGGSVFCFGANEYNQCGAELPEDSEGIAQEIQLPGRASAISAGNHHSMALVHGKVYAWGSNEYGQVSGDGKMGDATDSPQQVQIPEEVRYISAGICHAAAQGKSGTIYLWGCGENGQTGQRWLPEATGVGALDLHAIMRRCSRTE